MPDSSILNPTYHEVEHNLADLRLLFVADLDYQLEAFQETEDTELQADPDEPLQVIRATDAFGRQVLGPEVEGEPGDDILPTPVKSTTTRHMSVNPAKFGPYGDPDAMRWGDPDSVLQPIFQKFTELES